MQSEFLIREAVSGDAAELKVYFRKAYEESDFLLFEPEEVRSDDSIASTIENATNTCSGTTYICVDGNLIVGACFCFRGFVKRQRHCMGIALSVLASHHSRGIGREFLNRLEKWALNNEVTRIELNVRCDNLRAIKMYERFGFVQEGRKSRSILIRGEFKDDFIMAKQLDL
jgi:RimJ/RimL family protein N-acetyltransferase